MNSFYGDSPLQKKINALNKQGLGNLVAYDSINSLKPSLIMDDIEQDQAL